jgi:hypothetical protein
MDETPYSGPERRQGPDPVALQEAQRALASEVKATRQDLGRLATAVTTLGSDEKLQAAVNSVAEEQKRHWQRLIATVAGALAIIGVVVVVGASWANDAKDAATKAAVAAVNSQKVAGYVDHCLVHPSLATPGECGNTAATGQQSAGILALFCYLQLPEPQRTEATGRDCFMKASAQAKAAAAAATTTTTEKP